MCLYLIEESNVLYLRNCTGQWNLLEMLCTHQAAKKKKKKEKKEKKNPQLFLVAVGPCEFYED